LPVQYRLLCKYTSKTVPASIAVVDTFNIRHILLKLVDLIVSSNVDAQPLEGMFFCFMIHSPE